MHPATVTSMHHFCDIKSGTSQKGAWEMTVGSYSSHCISASKHVKKWWKYVTVRSGIPKLATDIFVHDDNNVDRVTV